MSPRAVEGPVVAGVRITHPERVVDGASGLTKLELALYFESIARRMLPHLADRPLSLVRCPDGMTKPCFYQKHGGFTVPKSVRRVRIREKTKSDDYLVADDAGALIALVQVGVLEFHTWNSRAGSIERPDRVVFDLDPAPDVPWKRVVGAARLVHEILEREKLRSFVKTTGGKGLHVVVPLAAVEGWDECLAFTRRIAVEMETADPSAFTTAMSKAKRGGRILLDVMRNVRGATSVAAFSTRARPGARVSMPLEWDELGNADPSTFTARALRDVLATGAGGVAGGEAWKDFGRLKQRLPSGHPREK